MSGVLPQVNREYGGGVRSYLTVYGDTGANSTLWSRKCIPFGVGVIAALGVVLATTGLLSNDVSKHVFSDSTDAAIVTLLGSLGVLVICGLFLQKSDVLKRSEEIYAQKQAAAEQAKSIEDNPIPL